MVPGALEHKAQESPGQVTAQLVGVKTRYTEVAGSIPGQAIYRRQPTNA